MGVIVFVARKKILGVRGWVGWRSLLLRIRVRMGYWGWEWEIGGGKRRKSGLVGWVGWWWRGWWMMGRWLIGRCSENIGVLQEVRKKSEMFRKAGGQ
jgi:hypothetical protein